MRYAGEKLRHLAVPLGGIGAGHVALCGDGALRQWQLSNVVNHTGFAPNSFFAIRVSGSRPPSSRVAILQSEEALGFSRGQTPCVNDDDVPAEQRLLVERFGGVERTVATVRYPFVRIDYEDSRLPVRVSLEAHTPFIPLNSEASGLPAAIFAFTVTNLAESSVTGCLAASLQNCVGWDGLSPIDGNRSPLLGGNVNRVSFPPGIVQVPTTLRVANGNVTTDQCSAVASSFSPWEVKTKVPNGLSGSVMVTGTSNTGMKFCRT